MSTSPSALFDAAKDERQWTEITLAVVQGNVQALRAAIAAGVPINHQDRKDDTALHYAIWNGRDELVPMLLEAGADPNRTNHKGQSPLHHACARRNATLVAALIRVGGDLGQPDAQALTPLMALARPAPSGLRNRHHGSMPEALLDLIVDHAGTAFWTEPVGDLWRQALIQSDGALTAAETWARLEAKGLAQIMDASSSSPRPAPSRRL